MKAISTEAKWFLATQNIQHPGRKAYTLLAEHYPHDLLAWIASSELEPSTCTFAAEIAGSIKDSEAVRKTLLPILDSGNLLIMEGAMLGLVHHLNKEVVMAFNKIAESDSILETLAKDLLTQYNLEIIL